MAKHDFAAGDKVEGRVREDGVITMGDPSPQSRKTDHRLSN
ncbi:hypothetical protein [Streptomyces sp. NBC_01171]|nr:hypothetical protein OG448_05725 [Streptomyces sp. NBC_01171]